MNENWVARLIEENYPSLLLYGIALTGTKYEAEDLVQEAIYRFLLIYDSLPNQNYKAWLVRVMRNYHYDNLRKQKRQKELSEQLQEIPESFKPDVITQLIENETQEKLLAKVALLKPQQREIFIAHYFLELPIKEIATLTGLKLTTVKVTLHRTRKQLRKEFTDEKLS